MNDTRSRRHARLAGTDARGFSLIEIMVALVIVGLTLAVATPAFNQFRTRLLRGQARAQVIDDLRAARQLAITRRCRVVVAFGNSVSTTDITSYKIHIDKNGDNAIQSGELVMGKTLPKGCMLSKVNLVPTDSLTFEISGLLKGGTKGGTLTVKSKADTDTLSVSLAGMVYEK